MFLSYILPMRAVLKFFQYFFLLNIAIALATVVFGNHSVRADWRSASQEPLGIAPDPQKVNEAIVQVYGARAYSWRGIFGIHTWIAIKEENAPGFTNLEVIGWRVHYGGQAISASRRAPDSRWFGAEPQILADLRGPEAARAIEKIKQALPLYPYPEQYTVWPGPNSNTFVAHIARQIPELRLDLPATAIGKDYIPGNIVALSPSGTGAQFSLFGLFGILVGIEEGVEVNILGLTFGIDPLDLAIKLPMLGRLGP